MRGCAPFTTDVFPGNMQKGMVGSYWKVINSVCKKSLILHLLFQGTNVMSLCDFANCNSAVSNKVTWMGVLVLTLAVFKLY